MKIILKSVLVLMMVVFAAEAQAVWTAPTAPPTGGNATPPVNVGIFGQQKTGVLTVGGFQSTGPAIFGSYLINGASNSVCDSTKAGAQKYNTTTNKIEYCDGTPPWKELGGGTYTAGAGLALLSNVFSLDLTGAGTGKYLTSDGTTVSWATPSGTVSTSAPITGDGTAGSPISMPQANGTPTSGFLSGADWNTFNSKVGGSGTVNKVPKWDTGGLSLKDSLISSTASGVGIGIASPNAKSILDLTSTTKGFLAPRMTTVQRDAITTPPNGLIIYNTDAKGFQFYDTTVPGWVDLTSSTNNLWAPVAGTNNIENTNAGNVGVGTDTPSAKLSVLGNLNILRTEGASVPAGPGSELVLQSPTSSGVSPVWGGFIACGTGTSITCPTDNTPAGSFTDPYDTCQAGDTGITYTVDRKTTGSAGGGDLQSWYSSVTCVASTSKYSIRTNDGILEFLNNASVAKVTLAQNGQIYISNTTPGYPKNSALLELSSSDKGVLIPRMTTVQRGDGTTTGIASPAIGLLIYNADNKRFEYWDGTAWLPVATIAGAALTKTDDTNVTLTLDANAPTALVNPSNITLGWTGTLAAPRGGTGFGTYAKGDMLVGGTTANTLEKIARNTSSARKFLMQVGDNTDVTNTIWDTLLPGDITGAVWTLAGNPGTTAPTVLKPINNSFIGTKDAKPFAIATDNTERMRILANGNVGIGTATPTSNFEVGQSATVAGVGTVDLSNALVLGVNKGKVIGSIGSGTKFTNMFKDGDSITVDVSGTMVTKIIEKVNSDTNLTLTTVWSNTVSGASYYAADGGTRFVVKGNGNVGIGTTTPTHKLTVAPSANVTPATYSTYPFGITDTAGTTLLALATDASNSYIQSFNSKPLQINSQGNNVGIGTMGTPGAKLQVTPDILIGEDKAAGTVNTAGILKMISAGDNNFSTTFTTGSQTANIAYTLPLAKATAAGQVLTSDTSGNLSWAPAGGGASCPTEIKLTTSATGYNGDNSGYDGANLLCGAGYHVCTAKEVVDATSGTCPSVTMPTVTSTTPPAWIFNGPPAFTAYANDCQGRKDANTNAYTTYGAVWDFYNEKGNVASCNVLRQFACCK